MSISCPFLTASRRLAGASWIADDSIEFVLVRWGAEILEQRRPPRGLDEVLRQQVHPLGFGNPRLCVVLRIRDRHLQLEGVEIGSRVLLVQHHLIAVWI